MFTFVSVMNYNDKSNIGYTLMVDVDYPVYLKPIRRDLPFLSEKRVINGINKSVSTFWIKVKYCYMHLNTNI